MLHNNIMNYLQIIKMYLTVDHNVPVTYCDYYFYVFLYNYTNCNYQKLSHLNKI